MAIRGPKPKEITPKLVEGLAKIHCTDAEMAAVFGMTREQFNRRKNADPEIQAAADRGMGMGKQSLRRVQFKKALEGNPAMLIWLGKQMLGQKDTVVTEHTGEMTVHAGARDELLSKLASLTASRRDSEGSERVN